MVRKNTRSQESRQVMKTKIVILTGAGISAESGIATFRAIDGLWENHRVEDVATPEGFARNPALVHQFYNARRRKLLSPEITPNSAHSALGSLSKNPAIDLTLITQNIDNLHERGGADKVIHMHGELTKAWCTLCYARSCWMQDMDIRSICPACDQAGSMRVDVVWFGEVPYKMDQIESALHQAQIFAAIGTSAQVYPAAGFVHIARTSGAKCYEFNLKQTSASSMFDANHFGLASQTVPTWVEHLLETHCCNF